MTVQRKPKRYLSNVRIRKVKSKEVKNEKVKGQNGKKKSRKSKYTIYNTFDKRENITYIGQLE